VTIWKLVLARGDFSDQVRSPRNWKEFDVCVRSAPRFGKSVASWKLELVMVSAFTVDAPKGQPATAPIRRRRESVGSKDKEE